MSLNKSPHDLWVLKHPGLTRLYYWLGIFFFAAVVTILSLKVFNRYAIEIFDQRIPVGLIPLSLLIVFLLNPHNFLYLRENENGASFFLGIPIFNHGPGPVYALWPFVKVVRLTIQREQIVVKGEATTADHNHCKWYEGTDPSLFKDDPIHGRLVVRPKFVCRFFITNPILFVRFIGGTIDDVKNDMDELVRGQIQQEFGRLTPALLPLHVNDISTSIVQELKVQTGEEKDPDTKTWKDAWGTGNISVYPVDIGLPPEISAMLAKRVSASLERYALAAEGLGRGEAAQAEMERRAEGIKELAKAIESEPGKMAALIEAFRDTLGPTDKTILFPGGDILGTLFGALQGSAAALPKKS